MVAKDDDSHHRRAKRQSVVLEIRVRRDDPGAALIHVGRTSDLGLGGAFVECETLLPVGTPIRVSIKAPTAWEPLEIAGEVRWVVDSSEDGPTGFGVRFASLGGPEATALYELINHSAFE
ncbi:MAG: PilZ domain-containing protein [Deltaproteobacteria bacterium]|nr:PilZ domain-containing protein [Deltaproteobacteria bacterium]